jgi:hypothetical protein
MDPRAKAALNLFGGVGTWLITNWQVVAIAAVIAFVGIQSARLSNAKHDLANARDALYMPLPANAPKGAKRVKWQDAYGACQKAQETQNAAIKAEQAESDARIAELERSVRAAQGTADAWRASAKRISSPLPKGNICKRLIAAEELAHREDE